MALVTAVRERLQGYRPRSEQLLFGISLLGVLNVVHLYIQQGREFDQGCLGFETLDAGGSTFDCAAVTSGPGSELLGLSNLAWGSGFYLSVALLTVLVFAVAPYIREWVQGVRVAVLVGGVGYSAYLTSLQFGQVDALCLPCLISALLAALLFGIQVSTLILSPSSTDPNMSSRLGKRQIALFVYLAATTLILAGADFVYFDGAQQSASEGARAVTSNGGEDSAQCRLNPSKSAVPDNGASLVNFQDITKGSGESGVTIVEYFDPNCPHCKDFHQVMKKLVAAHS